MQNDAVAKYGLESKIFDIFQAVSAILWLLFYARLLQVKLLEFLFDLPEDIFQCIYICISTLFNDCTFNSWWFSKWQQIKKYWFLYSNVCKINKIFGPAFCSCLLVPDME